MNNMKNLQNALQSLDTIKKVDVLGRVASVL